jgi:hypothetical protein
MAFKINDFKKELTYGGARPSLFQVELNFPEALGPSLSNGIDAGGIKELAAKKLTFLCNAARIPESTISQIEVPYFGRKVKVAGARTFSEWEITIVNDEDFLIRKAFEQWMAAINGHASNIRNSGVNASPSSYQADATVKHFSKGPVQGAIRIYKFVNCFPTNISAIDLAWSSTDQIEEFKVTLQYDWWEIDTNGDITPPEGS